MRALFTMSLLLVAGLLAGMRVDGSPLEMLGLAALGLLMTVAGALFALGVALRIRSLQAAPLMQTPIFVFLFLAPVWVPLDKLEGWIHAVASVNPVSAVVKAGRSLIAGAPEGVGVAFALLAAIGFGFSLWAWRGLRSAERAA